MQNHCRRCKAAVAVVALAALPIAGCRSTPPNSPAKSVTSAKVSPEQFRGISGDGNTDIAPIPKGHTSLPANLPAAEAWVTDRWSSPNKAYEDIRKQIDEAANRALMVHNGKFDHISLLAKLADSYRAKAKQAPTDPTAVFGWGYATWVRYNRTELGRLDRDPELDVVQKAARSVPFPHTDTYALLLFLLSSSRDPSPSLLPAGRRLRGRYSDGAAEVEVERIGVATTGEVSPNYPGIHNPYSNTVEQLRLRREMLEAQNRRMPNMEMANELIGLLSEAVAVPWNAGMRSQLKTRINQLTDQQRSEAMDQARKSAEDDLIHNASFISYTGGWYSSGLTEYAWIDNAHIASWSSTVNGVYPLITDVKTGQATVSEPLIYAYPGAPATVSRDGKWLAFIKDPSGKGTVSAVRLSDGHVVNWPIRWTSTFPMWLPGNKSLVLKPFQKRDLQILSLDSTTPRTVNIEDNLPTSPVQSSTSGAGGAHTIALPAAMQREFDMAEHWSNGTVAVAPDGAIIVGPTSVNRSYTRAGQTWDRPEFTVISSDGKPHTIRRITATVPGNYRRAQMCDMTVSPDGKRILWYFQVTDDNWKQKKMKPLSYHYWVSNLDGSSAREIGQCTEAWPTQIVWRPDGKGISFVYQQSLWYLPINA